MDTINLVFKRVNILKDYLEINGAMAHLKKHQSKYDIFSLAGSQAYRILVGVRIIPSFLHLLVFALKPYSSQDFRVIIILLV